MHKSIFVVLLLASLLRFWQLGDIPKGITHDEMGYIYNAYSIAKTGANVFDQKLPLFTWMTEGGFPFMPVPIYSLVPLFWIFPLTPFIARLLPAIMGVIDVWLLYSIVRTLFARTDLGIISAFFLAISPWHLHFTRSAYDANFALFFYLIGIATYLKNKWLVSVLAFILAIFSYRGMSVLFLPIMVILFWQNHKRNVNYLLGIGFCTVILIATMLLNGPGYSAEGAQLFNNPKMQSDIDTQIREAKGPLVIRRIFANKPIYILDRIRENYIKTYSPEFLFLYTEPSAIYAIWSRGRIYFIDVFFIILGFVYLFNINKKAAFVWTGFLLIGGLPGGIGGMPYSSRNFFLSAIFPVISAGGVLYLIARSKKPFIKSILIASIIFVYSYALGSYLYDYYGRYAHYGAEGWAKSIKDISLLAHEKKDTHDLILLGRTSFGDTVEYAFWNTVDPTIIQKTWKNKQSSPFRYYQIDTIIFSEKCLDGTDIQHPLLKNTETIYYITSHMCNNEATPSGKIFDYQGNTIWKLFELDKNKPQVTL